MFEKWKADILFHSMLKRPNIDKAYKMVGPEDSWYDTITTVHNSLAQIQKLPHEMVEIISHDGLRLRGIYYPGTKKTTVIWAHGYTSHAQRESAFPGLFYHSLGFHVLIPYLRAHDISEGKYISLGALESMDMTRWVEKVNETVPGGSIVLHGLSMGGGTVLLTANQQMAGVRCIISDAPSISIADSLRHIAGKVFKKDGEKVAPFVLQRFYREFGVKAENFEVLDGVKSSRYPIFLTAGSNENMEDDLAALKNANPHETEILILPGCNHGNGMYKQTALYQNALKDFIGRYVP